MDKYLEAIALEESKLASLSEKSTVIRNANNNKKAKIESYKTLYMKKNAEILDIILERDIIVEYTEIRGN